MANLEKLVIVTQKTAFEELVERFNTAEQARFYIEHMGGDFSTYRAAHEAYHGSLGALKAAVPKGLRSQVVERGFLPNFLFGPNDLVACLGRDGLVVNTAKYLADQPVLGFNPDPARIDGTLLPFGVDQAGFMFTGMMRGEYTTQALTMAKASLNDGQTLYAVNDLFVGVKSHTSALYRLTIGDRQETQSSSGIIIATGNGSTGWLRSILAGAVEIVRSFADSKAVRAVREQYAFDPESEQLIYSVREPFPSRTSSAEMVFGRITGRETIVITSLMPRGGVIFSDGVESDFLEFNSGAMATISVAERKVRLVRGRY